MSIIGPRPLLVSYLPWYTEEEKQRHDVRPGLSGLAQVNGRNSVTWEEKFSWDLKYVDRIVHPFAYVSPKAKLSEGCVVLPYAIINTECHIAEACIVNCGAIIDAFRRKFVKYALICSDWWVIRTLFKKN